MKIFKNRDLEEIYGVNDFIFSKDMATAPDIQKSDNKKSVDLKTAEVIKKPQISTKQPVDIKEKKTLIKKENNTISSIEEKTLRMQSLADEMSVCKSCELYQSRTNIVLGEGSLNARLMFVGEAPGADEDLKARPFVGRAGVLLTKMIEAMGLKREDIYIANIAKCRPPNNRNPFEDEALECIHFLHQQIAIINPEIIVTLGSVATRYLLSVDDNISKIRGKWQDLEGYAVMPSFHPAYLLRSPNKKKEAWSDLQEVMKKLGIEIKI